VSGLEIAAIITAIGGIIGVLIAASRYQREDAGALVAQQGAIVSGMRELNGELRLAHKDCAAVRDELQRKALAEAEKLSVVTEALTRALARVAELEAIANGEAPSG
jgi:hypothetical protein